MKYKNIVKGVFLSRPNRFIAHVLTGEKEEVVHVKNTGRCKEILTPGCKVYLEASNNPSRKTKYDLVAAEKQRKNLPPLLINIDSQIPNNACAEWLAKSGMFSGNAAIRREVTHRNSRFDFYIEDKGEKTFIEVKGVTQEFDGVATFPDAPTQRGLRHIEELIECVKEGYNAYVMFIIQMKGIHSFTPNREIHNEFAQALEKAQAAGVRIIARDCIVTPDSMTIDSEIPVIL